MTHMGNIGVAFAGFFGIIFVIALLSLAMMWLSAPVLLYYIYQTLKSIEKKLSK
jgi:hypothetical protein